MTIKGQGSHIHEDLTGKMSYFFQAIPLQALFHTDKAFGAGVCLSFVGGVRLFACVGMASLFRRSKTQNVSMGIDTSQDVGEVLYNQFEA